MARTVTAQQPATEANKGQYPFSCDLVMDLVRPELVCKGARTMMN